MINKSLRFYRIIEPWVIWLIASLFYMHQYFLRVSTVSLGTGIKRHFHLNATMLGHIAASFFIAT